MRLLLVLFCNLGAYAKTGKSWYLYVVAMGCRFKTRTLFIQFLCKLYHCLLNCVWAKLKLPAVVSLPTVPFGVLFLHLIYGRSLTYPVNVSYFYEMQHRFLTNVKVHLSQMLKLYNRNCFNFSLAFTLKCLFDLCDFINCNYVINTVLGTYAIIKNLLCYYEYLVTVWSCVLI